MRIEFTAHARHRMTRYGIREEAVRGALEDPDAVVPGHSGRSIAQKWLNGYVLRVVFEGRDPVIVVTVYRARRERYEV